MLIGIFALLLGANVQTEALSPQKDVINAYNIKEEPPLDEWMPDKNLQKALVSDMWLRDTSQLTQEALRNYTKDLTISYKHIENIKGLEYMINEPHIDISYNNISDLSPLKGLNKLKYLFTRDNPISDLSSLSGLQSLEILDIQNNPVSDLNPLSGMQNFKILYGSNSKIDDLHALSNLSSLTQLLISNTNVSDLSPLSGLNIRFLDISNTQVSELGPLSNLKYLLGLTADNNEISDLSPLSGLDSLTTLYVDNNHISDLSPLSGMKRLSYFSMANQTIINKELVGYDKYNIKQNNNVIALDKGKVALKPSTSNGSYDTETNSINWIYENTGKREAISTFNIRLGDNENPGSREKIFSGKVIQPIVVKNDMTSIKVKNIKIHVNDKWKPEDNLVSVINKDGKDENIKNIIIEGHVDTSKAGTYKITYTVLNNNGERISKTAIIEVQANANGNGNADNSSNNSGSKDHEANNRNHGHKDHHNDGINSGDKLPNTGYDLSMVGYLLAIVVLLGAIRLYLNRKQ